LQQSRAKTKNIKKFFDFWVKIIKKFFSAGTKIARSKNLAIFLEYLPSRIFWLCALYP
jgi:hypothetical protein